MILDSACLAVKCCCGSHRLMVVANWIVTVVLLLSLDCVPELTNLAVPLSMPLAVVSIVPVSLVDSSMPFAPYHRQKRQEEERLVALHRVTALPDLTVVSCSAAPLDTLEIASFLLQ